MSTVASMGVSQFLGSMVSTGGAAYFGVGALKSFHSLISLTQATISGLVSLGIEANEDREGVNDEEKVSKTLQERAWKIIEQDGKDILKATAFTAGGFALLVLGEYLKGQSMQQIFINSLGYAFQTEQLAQAFFTAILMTAGDTIMGMAALNTFKATIGLLTTGFSGGHALAIKAAEDKEGHAPGVGGKKVGNKMLDRSVRFIKNDMLDIPKSMLAGAFGAAVLAIGARWGGLSFSSSAANFIRAKILPSHA